MTDSDGPYGPSPEQTREPTRQQPPGPWGLWATIGFSLVIGVGYFLVQTILVVAAVILAAPGREEFDIHEFGRTLTTNGLFWSVATCAGAPVIIGLTVLFAALARGITVRDYLALCGPAWKTVGRWCLVVLLFIAATDSITYLVQGRIVPPVMEQVYATARFVPLLWLAFVVVAPFTEELFIRGFLFQGVAHSRLGPVGAIVLTSIVWSVLHTQYDLYGIAVIFLGGLLLGYARLRSGSVFVPIAMHMVQNLVATLEVAISLKTS
jgi:membrane protease YdiL (CAAX protease family)